MNQATRRRKRSNIKYRRIFYSIFSRLPKITQNSISKFWKKSKSRCIKSFKGERWKPVIGFEDLYHISTLSRIKSLRTNTILKPHLHHTNYYTISLAKKNGRKKYFILSRIVAMHFIRNLKNKPEVNHLNGIKTDNRIVNLKWATSKENVTHSLNELGNKRSRPILQLTLTGLPIKRWSSIADAAKNVGGSSGNLVICCQGKNHYAYGYKWRYA